MKTTQTNPEVKKSNDLRYNATKTIGDETIYVKIRLNDECKNGHQDFAITGDLYEAGKPKIDRHHISGGCIHEEVLKFFPEFKTFVDLHLCDYKGIPMHAGDNGFYFLRNGFNTEKPGTMEFKLKFCEYYRLTPSQFDELNKSENKLQYALKLQSLGILAQWEIEAKAAIEKLEELTNTQFVVDSVKTQFYPPTPEQIKGEEEKQASGYYTPEAKAKREEELKQKEINVLIEERDKKLQSITEEYDVKMEVLKIGGKKALDNSIFYNHSRTLAFNWKGYDRISDEIVNKIMAEIKLPEGVKIENKNK